MFRINLSENRIQPLDTFLFGDHEIRERTHLQEWLVHQPNVFNEDLLIIQKEFNGFDDTNERLDLLAIDNTGSLVIIENKLDDSGRDVTWQALKYTAYCSSLTTNDIISIYQRYLDKYCDGGSAVTNICEFLNKETLDEVLLNNGHSQRMILVAANFRKEVTSTVLWLMHHGIDIKCFKVTPYKHDEELFVNIQLILPIAEAKEFMIGMSNKDTAEKVYQSSQRDKDQTKYLFWEQVIEKMRSAGVQRYNSISPSKDHWLSSSSGLRGCSYNLVCLRDEVRVEVWISQREAAVNKQIFDILYEKHEVINQRFGARLNWQRLDHRISCRISEKYEINTQNDENWPEIFDWYIKNIQQMENAFQIELNAIKSRQLSE